MGRKSCYWILLLVIGYAGISSSATIAKEFRQSFLIQQAGNVIIQNVNGDIVVESWDRDSVEVFAEIEVKAGNRNMAEEFMEQVRMDIDYQSNRLFIEPDYPKVEGGNSFLDWIFGRSKPQVNIQFFVKVPSKMNLDLESVNGKVHIEKMEGKFRLRTTNGPVLANEIVGSINGRTVNGSLYVHLVELSRSDEVILQTTNGHVELSLYETVQADVDASTVNGGISTDFPLEVQGRQNSKQIRGQIYGGGGLIDLSTVNGSIAIYKE
ncbi:DUF4097 family beta strand repeat protein [bacterium]|nr:DUF4097 family beta strand repeat protein [bacterium]RQV92211.1 MAG: hypothetical protein EH221_11900 [bacterium]